MPSERHPVLLLFELKTVRRLAAVKLAEHHHCQDQRDEGRQQRRLRMTNRKFRGMSDISSAASSGRRKI